MLVTAMAVWTGTKQKQPDCSLPLFNWDMAATVHRSDAIVYAFNGAGKQQDIKFTGNGFDFYLSGYLIGHLGVDCNPETGTYDMCFQPTNGRGTYFSNNGSYAQVVMGALKADELHANGLITTWGTVSAGGFKTANGAVGKTENMTLKDASGKNYHLTFKSGLLCESHY